MLGYKKEEIVGLDLSRISDKEIFSRFKKEALNTFNPAAWRRFEP